MQYFCSFDSYALFLLQSVPSQPNQPKKITLALSFLFLCKSGLVFLSLKISYFNGPLSLEHFSGKGNL